MSKNKQDKFTRFAKDKPCQIRIPGVCNGRPETSVLCHLNGGGMATKTLSIHGAIGCSDCHDAVDFRVSHIQFLRMEIKLFHLEGVIRTQAMMVEDGVLVL